MKKKLLSLVALCAMVCTMFVLPVSAAEAQPQAEVEIVEVSGIAPYATGSFSGTASMMNSVFGQQSKIVNISSPTLPSTAKVTSIDLTINLTMPGSDPVYYYIQAPSGNTTYVYTGTAVTNVTITDLNGERASGTWKVYILGTATNYNVSTVNYSRMVVNYSY